MKNLTTSLKKFLNPFANPIIVKELRSRMRGARAFIILTTALLVMALLSYALYQLVIITSTWSYTPLSPQIGQTLFTALAMILMFMICLITPAITAGAISAEHENLIYEMLLTTPLKPTRILWGKLVSALSYVFLLIFAAIPMASLVFIYGGVSPREMVKALIVLLCTTIMLGTVGIFISTWLKRTARATVLSYLVVLFLLGAPTFTYGIAALIRGAEPPRWLLVPSPVSALFSAIAPSTSLGSSSLGMISGLSMIMAGNISVIQTDSIPRPLYHYTLPLYGLITLVLYFLAARLVRPARRWRIRAKEIMVGLITVLIFTGLVTVAFARSSNRYENISIFAAPTPFAPMPVEPMMVQQAVEVSVLGLPISDEEAIEAYSNVLEALCNEDLLADIEIAAIAQQTYSDPSNPEFSAENNISEVQFSDNLKEGIAVSADELPIEIIWVDDYEALTPEDLANPKQKGDVLILFSNLNPQKTGLLTLSGTIYYADQSKQNLTIQLTNNNGPWEVLNLDHSQIQGSSQETGSDEVLSPSLEFEEISQIYAAAISQAYLADNPLPEGEITELYLMAETELSENPITLPPIVKAGIAENLDHFPFSVSWVDEHPNKANPTTALVSLGNISSHEENGSVEVILDLYFDDEHRILATYILEKIDGVWQVTEFGGMG